MEKLDKNNFILGYLIGNQLKLEYEPKWHEQNENTLLIYQTIEAYQFAPILEVQ